MGRDFRDLAISSDPQGPVADVTGRDKRGHTRLWAEVDELRFIGGDEIEPQIDIEPESQFFTFAFRNGLFEQLAVQIETNRHDMAALRRSENAARPTNLQIAHRDAKARAQRAVLLDGADSFSRGANCHHFPREQEIGVSFMLGPADAPAQLIKVGETKPVRAIDDYGVGVWDIETAFNNRRANQHVDLPRDEPCHDGFQFVRIHLAMPDLNLRLRTKIDNTIPCALDSHHSVVQKENLTLPSEFAINRIANDPLIVAGHHRFHWQAVKGWGLNGGHVFYANKRKVQRSRNRSCGER